MFPYKNQQVFPSHFCCKQTPIDHLMTVIMDFFLFSCQNNPDNSNDHYVVPIDLP